jgi:hypothetical protein
MAESEKVTECMPGRYLAPAMSLLRKEWMRDYGLTLHQLDSKTVKHLLDCTPLGREILLVIMRLEMRPYTAAVTANVGRLGRLNREQARSKRAADHAENIKLRNRVRQMRREMIRAARRSQPKPPRPVVKMLAAEPDEDLRVSRMLELALKVRVA